MENENLENELIVEENEVLEQTNEAENVVTQTTEENVVETNEETTSSSEPKKSFADILKENPEYQEEFNKTIKRRLKRQEDNFKREVEDKYGRIERTLKVGLETDDLDEISQHLDKFYTENGKEIPVEPTYNERDLKILAKAEADEIINCGYDEIVDEVDRLAAKGVDKMSAREKLVFKSLAEERQKQESIKELASIGVSKESLEDVNYKSFAEKLNPKLSEKEKYEMYLKLNPKKIPEPIGSMTSTADKKDEVKDFYSYEEASKFTRADFKKNPKLLKAVEKSMPFWGKK